MPPTPKTPDPTPEEIAAKCAEIRSRWTPLEMAKRAGAVYYDEGRNRQFYHAAQVPLCHLPEDYVEPKWAEIWCE